MNWKKEGYKVGDKVLLLTKFLFNHGEGVLKEVEVVYVGTKILKVKEKDNEDSTPLKFNSRSKNGAMFGTMYYIFKDKEEYENYIKLIAERKELIGFIENHIKDCDITVLRDIKKLL